MDALEIIDAIDDELAQGRRLPLNGHAVIDAGAVYGLLDQLRATMPTEITAARALLASSEEERVGGHVAAILQAAEDYAARVHERAEREAAEYLAKVAEQTRTLVLRERELETEIAALVAAVPEARRVVARGS